MPSKWFHETGTLLAIGWLSSFPCRLSRWNVNASGAMCVCLILCVMPNAFISGWRSVPFYFLFLFFFCAWEYPCRWANDDRRRHKNAKFHSLSVIKYELYIALSGRHRESSNAKCAAGDRMELVIITEFSALFFAWFLHASIHAYYHTDAHRHTHIHHTCVHCVSQWYIDNLIKMNK